MLLYGGFADEGLDRSRARPIPTALLPIAPPLNDAERGISRGNPQNTAPTGIVAVGVAASRRSERFPSALKHGGPLPSEPQRPWGIASDATVGRIFRSSASCRAGIGAPGDQILTMGQVMVRVMPSICWMSRTTMRPSSFIEPASARAMTS